MPWYYYRGGTRKGPIDDPAFRQMAATGELEPTDLVWSPGMKEWVRAETVSGLLAPPPPPPQRPPTPAELFLQDHSARAIQATNPVTEVIRPSQPQTLPSAQTEPGVTARPIGGSTFAESSLSATAKKSAIGWYAEVLNKYADFKGRARRREFWWFQFVNLLIGFGVQLFFAILVQAKVDERISGFVLLAFGLCIIFFLLPSWAVTVRRMHDVGKPGWYAIVPLGVILLPLPLYLLLHRVFGKDIGLSQILLWTILFWAVVGYDLVLLVRNSQPGENRYGPNPKGINPA